MDRCGSSELHRTFRITCQGVYLCGEINHKVVEGKPKVAQVTRQLGVNAPKSHEFDPKPDELILGKVKRG